jgi:hypothetical protein
MATNRFLKKHLISPLSALLRQHADPDEYSVASPTGKWMWRRYCKPLQEFRGND